MFSIVLEKLNVVGVWYTYDQIILTGHNFSDHLFLIIREPGYWYQQPLSDYKKCQIAVCSSVAYGTHWDPQWQPDTTGVVITPLQQIHIDNRGQPAYRSLIGLGWGCLIDWMSSSQENFKSLRFTEWKMFHMRLNCTAPGVQLKKSHHLFRNWLAPNRRQAITTAVVSSALSNPTVDVKCIWFTLACSAIGYTNPCVYITTFKASVSPVTYTCIWTYVNLHSP